MTCKQLGGACDKAFHANTFEEIAELSEKHGMDMYQIGNEEHLKAMSEMKEWFENRRKEFDALPEGE